MSFVGTWGCSIKTPLGPQEFTLSIRQENGAISGEAIGAETVALLNPEIADGHLRWVQKVTKPMPLTIKFDVVHDGDGLTGTAKPGYFPSVQVIGRRLSSGAAT